MNPKFRSEIRGLIDGYGNVTPVIHSDLDQRSTDAAFVTKADLVVLYGDGEVVTFPVWDGVDSSSLYAEMRKVLSKNYERIHLCSDDQTAESVAFVVVSTNDYIPTQIHIYKVDPKKYLEGAVDELDRKLEEIFG